MLSAGNTQMSKTMSVLHQKRNRNISFSKAINRGLHGEVGRRAQKKYPEI